MKSIPIDRTKSSDAFTLNLSTGWSMKPDLWRISKERWMFSILRGSKQSSRSFVTLYSSTIALKLRTTAACSSRSLSYTCLRNPCRAQHFSMTLFDSTLICMAPTCGICSMFRDCDGCKSTSNRIINECTPPLDGILGTPHDQYHVFQHELLTHKMTK